MTLAVADASSVRTVAVMLLGLVSILCNKLELELELEPVPVPEPEPVPVPGEVTSLLGCAFEELPEADTMRESIPPSFTPPLAL